MTPTIQEVLQQFREEAAPKIALADKLHQLRENVINGKYD